MKSTTKYRLSSPIWLGASTYDTLAEAQEVGKRCVESAMTYYRDSPDLAEKHAWYRIDEIKTTTVETFGRE